MVAEFPFYFDSVNVDQAGGGVADFTVEADHWLAGWDDFEVRLPSLPEPIATCRQYTEVADVRPGMTVLDLGAYAGVSAMVFQDAVGRGGTVVAVEADPSNLRSVAVNFSRYREARGYAPLLVEGAVWSESGTVGFAAEGALGSAVSSVLHRNNERPRTVRAWTLSEIVESTSLNAVDVIKADIEGAEFQAFSDQRFFERFHPTLVFEPAESRAPETQLSSIERLLRAYGYSVVVLDQIGSELPLVVCR